MTSFVNVNSNRSLRKKMPATMKISSRITSNAFIVSW